MIRRLPVACRWAVMLAFVLAGCGEDNPATPHAVGSLTDESCRACHQTGAYGSPKVSHADRSNCTSCHTVSDYRPVPHKLDDPDCLSCHQDGIGGAKKTTHPDRASCATCHTAK